MAFDMYLDGERTFIDVHEEDLFYKINEDEGFPKLNWIWQNFYKSPKITPDVSNTLVHELILLKSICNEKSIIHVIDKLLPFFSNAYKSNKVIETASD